MVSQTAPFAQALLELGEEKGRKQEYLEDLLQIEKTFRENPELKTVLMHPSVEQEKKYSLLKSIFQDTSDQTLLDFLHVVCAHRISGRLDDIAKDYQRLYDESENIQNVKVQSAAPLDAEQLEALKAVLEKKLGCVVRIQSETDPALIAGLRIITPHSTIDGSYQGRLEKMKEQVRKEG